MKYLPQMNEKMRFYCENGYYFRSNEKDPIPTHVVPKKDPKKGRLVFNEVARNKNTVRTRYPLPNRDGLILEVMSRDHKSQFDQLWAFERLRVPRADERKTSWQSQYGQFCSRVASMGNINIAGDFQKCQDHLAGHRLGDTLFPYVDNQCVATNGTLYYHVP